MFNPNRQFNDVFNPATDRLQAEFELQAWAFGPRWFEEADSADRGSF